MPALVAGIPGFLLDGAKAWMAGTSPAMTAVERSACIAIGIMRRQPIVGASLT
ncbi:MAG: hypothetical protein HXX10_17820 [Rhodoplanes sp.]|uniref:hypothetical protein n=1 Tax=Rhodoplanes sp. TaxID=1968906 RepID=UPI0017C352C9|nr:hypothetical protein [Rhodoplanes sp.]NVO15895.1 hypothetical protein [Rhodoplanes sp.]